LASSVLLSELRKHPQRLNSL